MDRIYGGISAQHDVSDIAWHVVGVLVAVVLGMAIISDLKLALAGVVLSTAVLLPLIVVGLRFERMTVVLLLILYLAPEIRISAGLPIVLGDEALLFATATLMIAYALTGEADYEPFNSVPPAAWALALFFPLTMLTMVYGAARFDINLIRGDYFEFVKFGKYVLAIYIASQIRADRRALTMISWAIVIGGLVASGSAIAQAFDVPGVRTLFSMVYFAANPDKVVDYLEHRALGTIGNANELALFLGVSLVIASVLLRFSLEPMRRMLLWGCIAGSVAAILLSGSRMGIACAGVAMMLTFMRPRRVGRNLLLVAFTLGVVASVFLFSPSIASMLPASIAAAIDPLLNRLQRFNPAHLTNISLRFSLWQVALQQSGASILLGYGPAKGADFLATSGTIDSEIVMVTLRYGLVGLVTWSSVWYVFLRTGRAAAHVPDHHDRLFGRALWALLMVNALATTLTYTFFALRRMTLVCVLVGLSAALVRAHVSQRPVAAA